MASRLDTKVFLGDPSNPNAICQFNCPDIETVVLLRAMKKEIENLFVESLNYEYDKGLADQGYNLHANQTRDGESNKAKAAGAGELGCKVQRAVFELIQGAEDDQDDDEGGAT